MNEATSYGRHRSRTGQGKFPNPFFDIASEYVPVDLVTIFELCEFMWVTFGTWKSVSQKVASYFVTDVVLSGESDAERDNIEDFIQDTLKLKTELRQIGEEYLAYGNVFVSVMFPFDRFLECPKCKIRYRDSSIEYDFGGNAEFTAECVKCGYKGAFTPYDMRSPDKDRVKIVRWNPKTIYMKYHQVTGDKEIYWRIPQQLINRVKDRKDKFYIAHTPIKMLRCIMKGYSGGGETLFKFNRDGIYHLHENYLSGLPIYGWGIPPILANFKLMYYIQILRRYDEALAFDYIIPFRILYPKTGPAPGADGVMNYNMGDVAARLMKMVDDRRMDPTTVQIAPFDIGYQMAGGEGRALSPKDSLAFAIDELLNGVGYPAEMYKGSLTLQAAPFALRLFEMTWSTLVDGYNDLTNWIIVKISRHFGWGDVTAKLREVTLADDMERKALLLQAAAGMDISKGTAYRPVGIDFIEEQKRVLEEQQAIQQMQQKAMEEQQAQQGLSGGSSGGGEGGPGGEAGATPGDIHEQAKQTAQQLLLNTPESLRRGELIKIKHSNPTLHALVIQYMDEMRQEMQRQGGAQMMQQAKQDTAGGMVGTASAEELPSVMTLTSLIAQNVMSYMDPDDKGLQKIAMDIRNGVPCAAEAFHYIYTKLTSY